MNAILVTKIFFIDIQHLIILVKNIFQQNLAIASEISCALSVHKFIPIRSDLTFLLHNVEGVSFLPDTVNVCLLFLHH